MQIFFRRQRFTFALIVSVCAAICLGAGAQTLARPGWAGSGVHVIPWWQQAVFYRVDPALFQDSNHDGRGDIPGLVQRLDYLQALGVDALVLQAEHDSPALAIGDFGDLERAAVARHLRVLVALDLEDTSKDGSRHLQTDARLLGLARSWLTQGAAGILLDTTAMAGDTAREAGLLHQLRALTNNFPGERILIASVEPTANGTLLHALAQDPQLDLSPLSVTSSAAALRRQMNAALARNGVETATGVRGRSGISSRPLFSMTRDVPADLQRSFATLLLASHGAVLIDFGQELGEMPADAATGTMAPMQWTATNRTPLKAPAPPQGPAAIAPKDETVYQSFQAYVPPPKNISRPVLPEVVVSDAPPPVDPAMTPAFTTDEPHPGVPLIMSPNGRTANVMAEENDPASLLHLYRRLVSLHRQNETLRDGVQLLWDEDDLGALAWVRIAPTGARSGSVVVVCNLSEKPVSLSLDADLKTLHVRPGTMRSLLSGLVPKDAVEVGLQSTGAINVAPHAVFMGELPR
jgi:alpha-glucosidase